MRHNIFLTVLLCSLATWANAENLNVKETWNITARAGYNIGGTVPAGFPAELRKINGYSPKFNYSIGIDAERMLNDKFGVQAAVLLDRKGFKGDVTMRQYDITLDYSGSRISGPYTGNVVANIIQTGITIPVQVSWWLSDRAKLKFGPYASFIVGRSLYGYAYGNKVYDANGTWTGEYDAYLRNGWSIGSKIEIGNIETDDKGNVTSDSRGTFEGDDFNKFMRKFQYGLDLGLDYYFTHRIGAFADLSYGLNSAFTNEEGNPVNMGLHQLYLTVGITYKIK